MKILQTNQFKKAVKKFHSNQKKELDKAVKAIVQNPEIGERKKGDLADVRVYKFKMQSQLILLAYRFIEDELCLVMLNVGSHENFYRDLKS